MEVRKRGSAEVQKGKTGIKCYCIFAFLLFFSFALMPGSSSAIEAPRNPDSAKECAICHYRWIDTFFIDGTGSDLVEYQAEKVAAKPEICFSCHDGSVVDSRARVYNDLRHKINKPPPEHMKIPEMFPMDKDGNIQCATCHTAHGVSSEMGMEKTIFIRASNTDSAMCRICHTDKDGGLETGNHPIGNMEREIPEKLLARGARIGTGKNHLICETCHVVHGSHNESFLIESSRNSGLCLECHSDKNIFTPDGKRNHYHVINAKSEKVKIPDKLIKKGAKLGLNGEIICQTCHKIHNNRIEKNLLLIKKDKKSTLCLTCHTDKKFIADTKHNLIHSAPDEKNLQGQTVSEAGVCSACHLPHKEARKKGEGEDFTTQLCMSCHSKGNIAEKSIPADVTHPLNIKPFEKKEGNDFIVTLHTRNGKLTLPLFNRRGVQDKDGKLTCATCHDPHRWRADSTEGEIRKEVTGDRRTSFLRKASPDICGECHYDKFYVRNSKHDLGKVAPEEENILEQTPAKSGICGTCHIAHGAQEYYLWAREESNEGEHTAENICVDCHNDSAVGKDKTVDIHSHPVNIDPSEKRIKTSLPLFDKDGRVSKDGVMSCPTCHDPHRWDPLKIISDNHYKDEGNSQNSFLRQENSPAPKLCENCHEDKTFIEQTDHDLLVTAPEYKNIINQTPAESGTCGVCHLVHNSENKIKLWAQGFSKGESIMDKMCNYCHSKDGSAKDKIPVIDSHPDGQLITNVGRDVKGTPDYFPLFDEKTGEYSSVGNISCPSCHEVHKWHPRFDVKGKGVNTEGTANDSFLRAQTYNLMCIDCHGLDALFRFKYYHDPNERVETPGSSVIIHMK